MYLRKITFLSLSLLSINAMAYTIISEKTISTPGFKAHFEHTSNEKKILSPAYVSAISWAYDAQGRPSEYIKVQGDHNVSITNTTSTRTRYTYTYTLSCDSAYASHERTVELSPHESFTDSSHSYGVVQEESEGSWRIQVGTNIRGNESVFHGRDAVLRVRR